MICQTRRATLPDTGLDMLDMFGRIGCGVVYDASARSCHVGLRCWVRCHCSSWAVSGSLAGGET